MRPRQPVPPVDLWIKLSWRMAEALRCVSVADYGEEVPDFVQHGPAQTRFHSDLLLIVTARSQEPNTVHLNTAFARVVRKLLLKTLQLGHEGGSGLYSGPPRDLPPHELKGGLDTLQALDILLDTPIVDRIAVLNE